MPRYIICLKDGERCYYLEWSTIVSAPTTFGLSREQFEAYYRGEYANDDAILARRGGSLGGLFSMESRLARASECGISALDGATLDGQLAGNHAGPEGTHLSKTEVIDWYCKRRENPWGLEPLE